MDFCLSVCMCMCQYLCACFKSHASYTHEMSSIAAPELLSYVLAKTVGQITMLLKCCIIFFHAWKKNSVCIFFLYRFDLLYSLDVSG
jgi:hypothetical protein